MLKEIVTKAQKDALVSNMIDLLDDYDYQWSDHALDKIVNTWAENKANLISLFSKHPNYIEDKFMIAFDADYDREVDRDAIFMFKNWLMGKRYDITLPDELMKNHDEWKYYDAYLPQRIYNLIRNLDMFKERTLSENHANYIRQELEESHAHAGQKTSRVINKICTYLGYDKLPDYQREFAKYADALSPIKIKRHTVISLNPLDYLTMSFGNSWASCHTIDKMNKRDMPGDYGGCYSSGTMSYLLDPTSVVFYTVDASYDGDEYYYEPKVTRQMYHIGIEQEKFVQGRLYPARNDGADEMYTQYRNVMQNILSELLEIPNLWSLHRGSGAASRYICSEGTHYRDYANYSSCTLSRIKGSENEVLITVGHDPICISCGNEHRKETCIDCCHAYGHVCADCGCELDEDDVYYVNGEEYCRDCVSWCEYCEGYHREDETYIPGYGYICESCREEYFFWCDCCEEYHHDDDGYIDVHNGNVICNSCYERYYATCEACGEVYEVNEMHEHECSWYCSDCCSDLEKEEDEAV